MIKPLMKDATVVMLLLLINSLPIIILHKKVAVTIKLGVGMKDLDVQIK